MIAAGIGAAVKWFGSRRDKADDDTQGDDPIVRAMFKAFDEGDLDDLKNHVADDCRILIDSIDLAREEHLAAGWGLWADAINDLRDAFPDVHWELYDELTGKDEGHQKIAIRFVSTVNVDGEAQDLEVAGFGMVEDMKLTEWHQVADMETYRLPATADRRGRAGAVALASPSHRSVGA